MKNNKGKGRELINFLPLKKGDLIRGRGLIWEGDVIEDLGYMYVYIMRNDRDVMVNFVPGEYTRRMFFQSVTQAARKKKSRVILPGVDPMTLEAWR